MGIRVEPGATDITAYFYIVKNGLDAGDPNADDPLTGLINTDIGDAAHIRDRAVAVGFAVSALGSASAAHSDGGFIEVSATLAPGIYRLDLPDAAVATGVDRVQISLEIKAAAFGRTQPMVIELDSIQNEVWDALRSAHVVASSFGAGVLAEDLNTAAKASVNAEVVDGLTVDTIAELAQAQPATTPTLASAIMLLYMAVRDKLETTGSEQRIHNDAGTVIAKSALTFASGTFTRGKLASGP